MRLLYQTISNSYTNEHQSLHLTREFKGKHIVIPTAPELMHGGRD